jgi:type II secretory pathway pseudopilin PulG
MISSRKQSGISLIEVLVVIVLLLIGILSVIRLFPPGFLINKWTADQTAAARLAKQEQDRFANASSFLMDAIVPVIPVALGGGAYQFRVDTGATPDDLTEADPNVFGTWVSYFSDVNKVRRVIGESVRIPIPSTTALGRGSVYMLSLGPFMDVPWNGQPSSLFISGAPLVSVALPAVQTTDTGSSRPNPGDFLGRNSYCVDYVNQQIGFAPAPFVRQFLLNISYTDTSNPASPVVINLVDTVITVPASPFDEWISLTNPQDGATVAPALPANVQLVPFSDTCARKFVLIPSGPPPNWSPNDPYQYYMDPVNSPSIGDPNGVQGNIGVIVFNPLGRDYTEFSSAGPVPLTAHIDYDVLDWHIIHEDRSIPASSPFLVSLSLRDLKHTGDFEDDQTTYNFLFSGVVNVPKNGPGSQETDLMVYNVGTGEFVPRIDPNTQQPNYFVNYKEGSVTFSDAFGAQNSSGTFRFFYRAHGDWALAVQKAVGSYVQTGPATPTYNQFYLGNSIPGVGDQTKMYFSLSEAGKTVLIREYWYTNGASITRISNETFKINSDRTKFVNLAGQPLTWIDIHVPHQDATGWDTTSTGRATNGVQGISFRTRVVWKNGSQVTATSNGNVVRSRWRKIDLETILTRNPI